MRPVFAGAFGLAAVSACSAVTDFDPQCRLDEDCAEIGRSLICNRGTCAPPSLVYPEVTATVNAGEASLGCYELFGAEDDASDAQALTLATLLPLSGGLADEGPPMENGVRLAVSEINEAGGVGGRKLRVLACDSGTHPDVAERAAQHLVDVAHVPAIIGPGSSTEVIETFRRVAADSGTLLISPSATSPAITTLADDGLVWRTVPSDALQGGVIAGYLATRGYARVFVVHRDDAYGSGLAAVVRSRFCSARDCATTFVARAYPTDDLSEAQATSQAAIFSELDGFSPDVVVLVGYAADGLSFLHLAKGRPWPFVLAEGLRADSLVTGLQDRTQPGTLLVPGLEDTGLLCNIVGTYPSYPRNTPEYLRFADRYAQRSGGAGPGTYAVHAYDATYALAFAIAAASGAGVTNPSGRDLAEGLSRLSHGVGIDVGTQLPMSFGDGVARLRFDALSTIDLSGLSGPLDFDVNGEAASSMEMWNLDPGASETDPSASHIVSLGTVWDGVALDVMGREVYDFSQIPSINPAAACGRR